MICSQVVPDFIEPQMKKSFFAATSSSRALIPSYGFMLRAAASAALVLVAAAD